VVTVALVAVVVAVTALEAAFVLTEALVAALVVVRTPNGDWLNPAKEITDSQHTNNCFFTCLHSSVYFVNKCVLQHFVKHSAKRF
jgi:hypothetical protein